MNFDEMDIEPKSEPADRKCSSASKIPSKNEKVADEELQAELLKRTVPVDDGVIGYAFTCTKDGSAATWRCHVCNFANTWRRLRAHLDSQWHEESMSKYRHNRSNFTKVENIIADFSVGQPFPPGMEDEITGPCQIMKSLQTFERPLIGLEYLLELRNFVDLKEPRYLCLLCDKRGDPRTILVHLTSQNHYMLYLEKYFRKVFSLLDNLPKSKDCRANFSNVTSHLIAKLEEKYGRLQPTATREDIVNAPEQRSILLQKIDSSEHFSESPEDAVLGDMLTVEYVQNPQLLQKNFPLKPKHVEAEKPKESSTKSLFNKSSKNVPKKNIRSHAENEKERRSESPEDVVLVANTKPVPARNGHRSRERSPFRSRDRSPLRSRDKSPLRCRDRSLRSRERSRRSRDRSLRRSRDRSRRSRDRLLRRSRDRSLYRGRDARRSRERSSLRVIERSPFRVRERSPLHRERSLPFHGVVDRSPPFRVVDRSTSRSRSPFCGRERSPPRLPSHSHYRSPSTERSRRKYVSPSYFRTLRYRQSLSRSPRWRSRSPTMERVYRRSPSPLDRLREGSPLSSRYSSHRYRSPEREFRRVTMRRSPSLLSKRSRSRERNPYLRARRSRSRSKPCRAADMNSGPKVEATVDDSSETKERERSEPTLNDAYKKEAKKLEERLNKEMDGYIETPESHPAYQDEWKKYWCSKYKEVLRRGTEDPLKYDYKPEWIIFWNKRVKELFDRKFKLKMKALKNKYRRLDCNKEERPIQRVSSKISPPVERVSPKIPQPIERISPEIPQPVESVSSISPDENDEKPVPNIKTMRKELTGFEIKDNPTVTKERSLSPWENDDLACDKGASKNANSGNLQEDDSTRPISVDSLSPISDKESPQVNPFRRSRSRSRSKSHSAVRSVSEEYPFKNEYRKPPKKRIHFDNPLNIITVLRQLSVLEFQLGSHASHVINLLTSGLAMERIKPQSSIDLLTKENILFLELVKEKLKGQLLAGIVPKAMVKATLFGIKNIDELLDIAPKLKPTSPPPIPAPPPALLYGAGADRMGAAFPGTASAVMYGAHMYGQPFGGYNNSFKHVDRGGNRHAFRKTNPKRKDGVGGSDEDEFPFRNNDPVAESKPTAAVGEMPVDKNIIALQIAEVLTQQGRSEVSNEELQTLINTVVENLKREPAQLADATIPAIMNALATISTVPNANLENAEPPAIPAGFNLNDVSSKTMAMLQDACENASTGLNAIEDLTEADIIEMLRNFKSIPRVKQEKLIEYLRKLEATDPERVEELKKYVNVL